MYNHSVYTYVSTHMLILIHTYTYGHTIHTFPHPSIYIHLYITTETLAFFLFLYGQKDTIALLSFPNSVSETFGKRFFRRGI